ncbi:Inhibitor of growth protein 1 [Cladobotryum mycophilum]|uniref:Inhibitor of growth protein 1 n=1 Tax=Cladobotryum mycophilum TaxID=491253 RepID=A0ABR0SDH0_9HYPO
MAAPTAVEALEAEMDVEAVSPKNKTATFEQIPSPPTGFMNSLLTSRADPDAQTTVTDFLDFTEYLPSDMTRSLTLIGKLDQAYADASLRVDDLTTTWGQLPSLPAHERPSPVQLRANISEQLNQALNSRVFAHAEAARMSDNVSRHYHKATALLAKLKTMMENYPTDEQRSPVETKSPQMVRAKLTVRATGEDGQKVRRPRVPRITVPGEVLAPYEIEYDTFSDDSDISSDEESDSNNHNANANTNHNHTPATNRRTPAPPPRIKVVSNKSQRSANRPARPVPYLNAVMSAAAAANAAALLNPPPENAVVGSPDAPWLQLTQYELAKLRKRMKKNATWTPSETMIARELKALNRGPDAYREAKKKAEEEGKVFEAKVPAPVVDDESGTQQLPAGAISADSIAAEEVPTSNRGMKLNEAKKLKREQLAKMAAEEAEESARKMQQTAKLLLGESVNHTMTLDPARLQNPKPRTNSRSQAKRKRSADGSTNGENTEGRADTPSKPPPAKRTKTETPVPVPPPYPQGRAHSISAISTTSDTPAPPTIVTPAVETPVPIPIPPQSSTAARSAASPVPIPPPVTNTSTSPVPIPVPATVKPPTETPVPLPRTDIPKTEPRVSTTPIPPPPIRELPGRESTKRETRADVAKRTQRQSTPATTSPPPTQVQLAAVPPEQANKQSSSRTATPRTTPAPESLPARRPGSRGKATSQEPQPSLAADRPRRTSTARNTPVPEIKPPPSKRPKRPAPGVVSTTNSGGNSAVGKRKAAPKKKARTTKKEKGQVTETEMEEVDDEGNPIDPNEPRYCLCNNVSFGTMIQCDNVDNCKQEWFHLECVGLSDIPARTTKWYCPDCRKLLNIGEKGEVNARGVKK